MESEVCRWSRIPKNTMSLSRIFFCATPEVQLNHFFTSHSQVRNSCWNGTISFENSIETDNSLCSTTSSCYEIVESQTSFTICWVGKFIKVGVRKVGKVRVEHFTSDSGTLRPVVCCGSDVMIYIILFTFLLLHLVQPVHDFLWKLTQIDSSLAGPSLRLFYWACWRCVN